MTHYMPRPPQQRPVRAAPALAQARLGSLPQSDDDILSAALSMQVPDLPAQDDYEVPQAGQRGRQVQAKPVTGPIDPAQRQMQVLYIQLLASATDVATELAIPTQGTTIAAAQGNYVPLFRNNTNNTVRVQVFADFQTPGAGVVLALTADRSDVGKIDELAFTAGGRTQSVSVILPPTTTLWARDRDPAVFPLAAVDTIRVRVFDPSRLLSYANLYPEKTRG